MFKLLISGEREGRQSGRSTRSMAARYTCITCDRTRSRTYHLKHPPEEPPPPPGVCRRCIREERLKEHFPPPPATTIYEVHHYHHACTCKHELRYASTPVEPPLLPPYPGCAELPADEMKGRSLSPHQLLERAPPPVKFGMKPV